MRNRNNLSAIVLALSMGPAASATSMGTAFTYQGRLIKEGLPVNDTCDFTFELFDAPVDGDPMGNSPQGPMTVPVTDGLFSVYIDFGPDAMDGTARWLEMTVQCTGDPPSPPLTPRHELKPAPHALALPGLYTRQNDMSPNIIGGFHGNLVSMGVRGATISGGGRPEDEYSGADNNRVTDEFGTVGGGQGNQAGDGVGTIVDKSLATVGGGFQNTASGLTSSVCGGYGNTASGYIATVGGGWFNVADGRYAFVGGGRSNYASGEYATVPGGAFNVAGGDSSLAAGTRAKVRDAAVVGDEDGDQGTFVWADATSDQFVSTGPNQFLIRAEGGVGIGTNSPSNELSVAGSADFSGNVGIGTTTTPQKLCVDPGGAGAIVVGGPVTNAGGRTSLILGVSAASDGYGFVQSVSAGGSTYGDLVLNHEAGNVGIGTTAPTERLHVNGSIRVADDADLFGLDQVMGFNDLRIYGDASGGPDMYVNPAGNVGVGTSAPAPKLEVVGEIRGSGPIGSAGTVVMDGSVAPRKLSSTDALEFHVGGTRVLRLEPLVTIPGARSAPNVIAGWSGNFIGAGVLGATIAGGGSDGLAPPFTGPCASSDCPNRVLAELGTVGGGVDNTAGGQAATVAGGWSNHAIGFASVIGGGYAHYVGGSNATVPGGYRNVANGDYGFAAGQQAEANHPGSFVWNDASNLANDATFGSTTDNQFRVHASGGTQFFSNVAASVGVQLVAGGNSWSAMSDRNVKENLKTIDPTDVLEKLSALPITEWNLVSQGPEIRHLGPMAQDFYAAFGLGESDRYISSSDADGIALAAIQGLHQVVQHKEREICELQQQNARLEARLAAIEATLPIGGGHRQGE